MEQGTSDPDSSVAAQLVKLCECGCGKPTPIARRNDRVNGYIKGEPLRFVHGHYSKLKSIQVAAWLRAAQERADAKLCECGCGEVAPIARKTSRRAGTVKGQPRRFVAGHYGRFRAAEYAARSDRIPPAQPKLCECGCGERAPIAQVTRREKGQVKGQSKRFVAGHHPMPKGPNPKRQKLALEPGQRIGRSVVMDADTSLPDGAHRVRAARLGCDCGKEYVRRLTVIFRRVDPAAESCRECSRGADLSGRRFGRLTAIRWTADDAGPGRAGGKWLCVCDCGTELTVRNRGLTEGWRTSCGCKHRGPRNGYAPGDAAFNTLLRTYQANAKARHLPWELNRDDFRHLTSLECHYCGAAPSKIVGSAQVSGAYTYNGLDRVDNALGYELGNVVPACRQCNRAKMNMPYDEFLAWIARLASFHFFRPDMTPAELLKPPA